MEKLDRANLENICRSSTGNPYESNMSGYFSNDFTCSIYVIPTIIIYSYFFEKGGSPRTLHRLNRSQLLHLLSSPFLDPIASVFDTSSSTSQGRKDLIFCCLGSFGCVCGMFSKFVSSCSSIHGMNNSGRHNNHVPASPSACRILFRSLRG